MRGEEIFEPHVDKLLHELWARFHVCTAAALFFLFLVVFLLFFLIQTVIFILVALLAEGVYSLQPLLCLVAVLHLAHHHRHGQGVESAAVRE